MGGGGGMGYGGNMQAMQAMLTGMQLMGGGMGGGYGYDDDEDGSEDEIGPYGFTHEEEMELLSQGVKPWDDDAHDVLAVLRGDYDDGYGSEEDDEEREEERVVEIGEGPA